MNFGFRRVRRTVALFWVGWGCWVCVAANAQQLRDPTTPPVEARAVPKDAPDTKLQPSLAVVVRDGKPHLVVGTRLAAVGQSVGNARLERITETEVWLREGKQLTKVPRFTGVQRNVVKPDAPCTASTTKAPGRSLPAVTPVAPCEGVQP